MRTRVILTMRRSGAWIAAILVGALTASSIIAVQPAMAYSPDPSGIVIYNEPGVVTVTIPNPALKSKAKKLHAEPAYVQPMEYVGNNDASHCSHSPPTPSCKFWIQNNTVRRITPPGGTEDEARSGFRSLVDVYQVPGCCYTQSDHYEGYSYSLWYGVDPFYATSIKHRDVWDIDYVAAGFSVGGAPSGSVNHGNGRVSYENTVNDTYAVEHNVEHIYLAVTGGTILQVRQEVHGSFQFGSTFWTTDSYSRVALP
ncbi:hypothetical protein [Allorhizocola rhizosphaerae]|uniref:hypothetical protein n=1 Tax=Allorhizocola rhizosphaerae TaxID=1872709 RepID=UPI0013C2CCC5|nr:hypothetical protein [Allorhizocola rhizosphaerae]